MSRLFRGLTGITLVSLAMLVHTVALAAQNAMALEHGRTLTQLLYDGQADSISSVMSEEFRSVIGGRDAVAQLADQVASQLGDETKVMTEETYSLGGTTYYYRIARFSGLPNRTVTVNWIWRDRDQVESAEQIATCGNSGNSSEPHLHYHLQTESQFGSGVGLPAFFNHYEANGEYVERGEPIRGQQISPTQD